jgi:hypothetical protein
MLLFEGLQVTDKYDAECAALADRHYSRQTVGDRQFMPPGRTIVIRNQTGTILFGWNWQYAHKRRDRQDGYCCNIFRNESTTRSSEIIRECVAIAFDRWGPDRVFTYVDPTKIRSANPGYCFKQAGWTFLRRTHSGLHLLAKEV